MRGLRTEIGRTLLSHVPRNLVEAEQRATETERYYRDVSRKPGTTRRIERPAQDSEH